MARDEEMEEPQEEMVSPVEVRQYLSGISFPADKQTLIDTAEQQGAESTVMDMLNQLPDREYEGPTQVSEEISKIR